MMSSTADHLSNSLSCVFQRFQGLSEPKQRYEVLLEYAKRLAAFPATIRVPENKVPGCVSQVSITATLNQGKVQFQGDSDSQVTKGLLALLVVGLSGLTPEEILQVSPNFIQATGLNVSLMPSRANGFYNIFKTMKAKGLNYYLRMAAESFAGY